MNAMAPSWSTVTRTYSQLTTVPQTTVSRVNAAAFRVSHVLNQPMLTPQQQGNRGRDSVSISPSAYAMLKDKGDIRPLATLPAPAETKTGMVLSITV